MTEKKGAINYTGVFSLNSIFCFVAERGMPGLVIPLGSGDVKAYSRAERTVRWKLGQEDYAAVPANPERRPPAIPC
jgi:hypothetical protein